MKTTINGAPIGLPILTIAHGGKMKIVILGATGFIGKHLVKELTKAGHQIVAVGRDAGKIEKIFGKSVTSAKWDAETAAGWSHHLERADAIVNLAGENIGDISWNEANRKLIVQSRVKSCNAIYEAIEKVKDRPEKIIQASAIGYYGNANDFALEESSPAGNEFLSQVTLEWENAIKPAEKFGVKVITIRSATVLGNDGGALPKIAAPFRFYLGGVLGSGKQWFSWIHILDEVAAIRFLVERDDSTGVYNLAAPNPVPAKLFFKAIQRAIGKPALLWIPAFLVKFFMGEKGEELILSSKKVLPKRLLDDGFKFLHPSIDEAMKDIFSRGIK